MSGEDLTGTLWRNTQEGYVVRMVEHNLARQHRDICMIRQEDGPARLKMVPIVLLEMLFARVDELETVRSQSSQNAP